MSSDTQPAILVIIGISGDLAKRKLLPAIREIAGAGMLPDKFKIVGISRRNIDLPEILPEGDQTYLSQVIDLVQLDLTDSQAYHRLDEHLQQIEASFGAVAQRLFYLSIPPQAAQPVVHQLGEAGLNTPNAKLLLEKPFGTDLISAEELIENIRHYFAEEQIYRIDHYMAKEMAQNIVVFRADNSLFRRTWNSEFIEGIEIIASEEQGIEGRGAFYEQTGALRDLVQSHLLQLAALTLMELPDSADPGTIPAKRLQALQQIQPPQNVHSQVQRGQYNGYREEADNPHSTVETFARLTLYSTDPRWKDVPITITTGKKLNRKATEIRVKYKQVGEAQSNTLTLRIHPNEGAEVCLWTKKPGYDNQVQQVPLDFSYSNHYEEQLPDAYERVFVDALRADHSLFTTSDEVLASWRILAPVQRAWEMDNSDLAEYESGADPETIGK